MTLRTPPQKQDFGGHLAQCEYFTVDVKNGDFNGTAGEKSFVSLLITDGAGTLTCGGETVNVQKGGKLFPAREQRPLHGAGQLPDPCDLRLKKHPPAEPVVLPIRNSRQHYNTGSY